MAFDYPSSGRFDRKSRVDLVTGSHSGKLASRGEHLRDEGPEVALLRPWVEDAGAQRFAAFVDGAGHECPPPRLDGLGKGAVEGIELLGRTSGRSGPERHDRRLRNGREL